MRNRAKCKLCKDVLESFHQFDYVTCKCGQISIAGGDYELQCAAKDWKNFLRLNDEDQEIPVKVREEMKEVPIEDQHTVRLTRDQLIHMEEETIKNMENLPRHAMEQPINNYEFYSYRMLILSILKTPDKE